MIDSTPHLKDGGREVGVRGVVIAVERHYDHFIT